MSGSHSSYNLRSQDSSMKLSKDDHDNEQMGPTRKSNPKVEVAPTTEANGSRDDKNVSNGEDEMDGDSTHGTTAMATSCSQSPTSKNSEAGRRDDEKNEKRELMDNKQRHGYREKGNREKVRQVSRNTSQRPVNTTTEKKYGLNSTLIQIIIVLVAVGAMCLLRYLLSNANNVDTNLPLHSRPVAYRFGNLTRELEKIQGKYQNLGEEFWDLIAGPSWSHVQGAATVQQPVVLMLVGRPGSSTLEVVAKDVARLYSHVFTHSYEGVVHIDGAWVGMSDKAEAKLHMDKNLQEGFEKGQKVALVTQFDELPPCSIMLFHSYCDNENAPYKDAAIIFTVQLKDPVPKDAHHKDIEELLQNYLNQLWLQCPEELSQNKITAMHSRVSNNIAFVDMDM